MNFSAVHYTVKFRIDCKVGTTAKGQNLLANISTSNSGYKPCPGLLQLRKGFWVGLINGGNQILGWGLCEMKKKKKRFETSRQC